MKILVAPNSYKECASSCEAAESIEKELRHQGFSDVVTFPLSDGGDGFLDVCKRNFQLRLRRFTIRNCFNSDTRTAPIGFNEKSNALVIEAAEIIGLRTIPASKRDPKNLNTENFGILLRHLNQHHPTKITIGIGGTGTSDLGIGLSVPFGLMLFDKHGKELSVLPKHYASAEKIVLPRRISTPIEVVLDVEVPLLGKNGTNSVFASQKGANPTDIALLERGAKNIIRILKRDHGLDFKNRLIGAGGGLTLGLSLIADVDIVMSRQFLVKTLGLKQELQKADLVITGEGKFDMQSFMNKATGVLLHEAQRQKKSVILIVGRNVVSKRAFGKHPPIIREMLPLFSSQREAIQSFRKGIAAIIKSLVRNSDPRVL